MIINEAGDYTLRYTATDDCGNSTVVDRELVVEIPITYRTVFYTDGTLIINESSIDEADNITQHGAALNVYSPLNPDGATDVEKYIFSSSSDIPWNNRFTDILSVEIGSNISPTSTAYWFYSLTYCESFGLTNLDTSNVTNMAEMFHGCINLTSIDLSGFNTGNVTSMKSMFYNCTGLLSLDLSGFDTGNVLDMSSMFWTCRSMTSINLTGFDTSNVTTMEDMFFQCQALTSLDLSSFNTINVTIMKQMFRYCYGLITIYASTDFVVDQVTSSNDMFGSCSALVGGAGTVWSSSYRSKTRAKIDGGTADPGYFTAKS